jgi:hypothetical protein
MKTPALPLLLLLIFFAASSPAQVQWYQNQDANNPPPNGTFATKITSFTNKSFIASYQWSSEDDQYIWKISKSHINGTEQKSFFVSGTWATAETKIGRHQTVYVLLRSFPAAQPPVFIVYKLDSNLVVRSQRQITLPNNFYIYNINAFELDQSDNIYMTGDGQHDEGNEMSQASFILKADKNLTIKWRRVDTVATSYTQLQVEPSGKLVVVEDDYNSFPQLKIRKYTSNGILTSVRAINTDPGRFNVLSKLDEEGNLFLYGGQSVADTAQGMYLYKVSRQSGNVVYRKTHFTAAGIQLNDLAIDNQGRIFGLITKYLVDGEQQCLISRISAQSGNIQWSRTYGYSADSCVLNKLVLDQSDRIYAVGEKRNSSFLSKGMVMRLKKNGEQEGMYMGPDSIGYQRSHVLIGGITDRDGQLITIGNTNDFDPYTFNSTYFRAFTARFGASRHHGCEDDRNGMAEAVAADQEKEEAVPATKLVIYPNPVRDQLNISQLTIGEYDRVTIYNMQGAQLLQQSINSTSIRLDVGALTNGVYLLVLRSSVTMKEKTMKFMVSE